MAFLPTTQPPHYKKWVKKRWFVPNNLKRNFSPSDIHGVYFPVWTFDSYVLAQYSGTVGKTKTRWVGTGKNRRMQTYTEWYNVRGTIDNTFDDITIRAGGKLSQKNIDRILPFPQTNYCVYSSSYLSGYSAEHYEKDINVAFCEAEDVMRKQITNQIVARHNADHAGTLKINLRHIKKSFKYLLVPIYIGAFKYAGKVYNFFMNGATGRTDGKTPVSFWKVLFTVVLTIGAVVGLYFLTGGS